MFSADGTSASALATFVERRSIPYFRKDLPLILHATSAASAYELALRAHGLSLSDQFWYRAEGIWDLLTSAGAENPRQAAAKLAVAEALLFKEDMNPANYGVVHDAARGSVHLAPLFDLTGRSVPSTESSPARGPRGAWWPRFTSSRGSASSTRRGTTRG